MLQPKEIEQMQYAESVQSAVEGQKSVLDSKMFLGGVSGAGLGILSGIGLMSGIVPGAEAFGVTLPVMLASCMAGVGTIVGSFIDLTPDVDSWRKR